LVAGRGRRGRGRAGELTNEGTNERANERATDGATAAAKTKQNKQQQLIPEEARHPGGDCKCKKERQRNAIHRSAVSFFLEAGVRRSFVSFPKIMRSKLTTTSGCSCGHPSRRDATTDRYENSRSRSWEPCSC
jgi:trimethylamine:corrinoid methyltransferase-like protein